MIPEPKYKVGDEVYIVIGSFATKICPLCDGSLKIMTVKKGEIDCMTCYGSGKIPSYKFVWNAEKRTIKKIRIEISVLGCIISYYTDEMLDDELILEDQLYDKEKAQEEAHKQNALDMYRTLIDEP